MHYKPLPLNPLVPFLLAAVMVRIALLYLQLDGLEAIRMPDEQSYHYYACLVYEQLTTHGVSGLFHVYIPEPHKGYYFFVGILFYLFDTTDPFLMYVINALLFFVSLIFVYRIILFLTEDATLSKLVVCFVSVSPEFYQPSVVNGKDMLVFFISMWVIDALLNRRLLFSAILLVTLVPLRFYFVPLLAIFWIYHIRFRGGGRQWLILLGFGVAMMAMNDLLNNNLVRLFSPATITFTFEKRTTTGVAGLFDPLSPGSWVYLPIMVVRTYLSPLFWKASAFREYFSSYFLIKQMLFPFAIPGVISLYRGITGEKRRFFKLLLWFVLAVGVLYALFTLQSAARHRYIIEPFLYLFMIHGFFAVMHGLGMNGSGSTPGLQKSEDSG